MDVTESLEETARYVRLALPLMSKHGIPITPKNYTVWYHYVSGKDKELQDTIDSIIKKKESFSEKTNAMIYQRYFIDNYENTLNGIRENLQHTLLVVFSELTDLTGQTKEYEESVLKSVNKLSENMSIMDIRSVLDEIINATKAMGRSGRIMQQRFKETTEMLKTLQHEFENAKTELLVDFLTSIANRKAFDETLTKLAGEATSHLCLLIIDIDHFKSFNDKYGHIVGDEVLRFVAKRIQKVVRGNDFVARYGGEEFAVLLQKTPLLGARTVAENVRLSFAQLKLERKSKTEQLGSITVSIGAAQYRPGESLEKFINRADQALYFAKNAGRNRVATESEIAR